jgi:hypothetical protein
LLKGSDDNKDKLACYKHRKAFQTKLLALSSKNIGRRACVADGIGDTASWRLVISPAGTLGGAGGRKYLGLGGSGGGSLSRDKTGRLHSVLSDCKQPGKEETKISINKKKFKSM